jgi:hypothetical protein
MADNILLGWVAPEERTPEQQDRHLDIMRKMPVFSAPPTGAAGKPPVGTKLLLTDLWKHPKVVAYFGRVFRGMFQFTGSCVGVGGGNVIFSLNMVEVIKSNEPEKIIFPWFWYNYGMSRRRAGMRGRGEGSFGSTFADSWANDGTPSRESLELALPSSYDKGWRWDANFEYSWSNGDAMPAAVVNEASNHKGTSTPVSSSDQVRDFILNGYGSTRASMRFVNPRTASVRGDALVGSYNGRGGHQTCWLGYWNHPNLGELFWEQNTWGTDIYGTDPAGGADGGCWVTAATVQNLCQDPNGEVFAFSQYNGYPAQPEVYDWANQSFLS